MKKRDSHSDETKGVPIPAAKLYIPRLRKRSPVRAPLKRLLVYFRA